MMSFVLLGGGSILLKRLLYVSAVIAAIALTANRVMAGPILYTFVLGGEGATTATLESFDASSPNTPTTIGPMGVLADFGGLAYDSANNTMYMVDGFGDDLTTTHSSLYSLNLTTGAATLIGSTGLSDVSGLTYDSANNTLYAAQDAVGALQILNLSTGAASPVGTGIASAEVGNLAYDSANSLLYGWVDCGGCGALYSIDTGTGVGTLLSSTGLSSNDSGIVYDPATNLFWDLDVTGRLTTIDPSTFAQILVGTTDSESSGLALIPAGGAAVPEPSTILLIGSGIAMLLARRTRR
jgi:hypothetical protein